MKRTIKIFFAMVAICAMIGMSVCYSEASSACPVNGTHKTTPQYCGLVTCIPGGEHPCVVESRLVNGVWQDIIGTCHYYLEVHQYKYVCMYCGEETGSYTTRKEVHEYNCK